MSVSGHDRAEFGALTERYRREIHVHCYRMMGALHDAEDMVQETFLKAWRRRETLERPEAARAWLYKVATNTCLDALRKRPRRYVPATREDASDPAGPIPADVHEPIWLEPYPDDLLAGGDPDPEEIALSRERIRLAFIAALQLLPPRQRAAVILQDALDWQAREIADLLDTTVSAVKSALHRARTTLAARADLSAPLDEPTAEQLAAYVQAWETADVDGLIALLRDDARFSMPPIPSWYAGREAIRTLVARTVFAGEAHSRWRIIPARANGQPAFGLYRQTAPGEYAAYGIQVLTVVDGRIADITTFRAAGLMTAFGLSERVGTDD